MYQKPQQKYETSRREGRKLLQLTSIGNDFIKGFWSLRKEAQQLTNGTS